jgi:hypothetical protein
MNFTAVPQDTLGYLTVWPAGGSKPVVSTLNAPTGEVTANAAIVPAGTGGDISVFVTDNTDLVADINGYFAPPGQGGLSLYPPAPCRVLDTRNNLGAFSEELTVLGVGAPCAIPANAQAFVFNATVVPQGSVGYLTLWPDSASEPVVSTLNASDGGITSNMAIVPTLNGLIDAFTTDKTNLILDVFSYFAPESARASISLSDPTQWYVYGSGKIERRQGGFVLRYAFNGIDWASVADDFRYDPTIGHDLDCSIGCQLVLTVKALDGARKLGITDRFPNDNFEATASISDGLDYTLAYWLPRSKNPFAGIALHFGAAFGDSPPLTILPDRAFWSKRLRLFSTDGSSDFLGAG